jgi:protocatechuate 3,4-dioxygenase beta subunit
MRRILIPAAFLAACVAVYLALFHGQSGVLQETLPSQPTSDATSSSGAEATEELPGIMVAAEETPGERENQRTNASTATLSKRVVTGKVGVGPACSTDQELRVYAWSGEVDQERWQLMHSTEVDDSLSDGQTLLASAAIDPDLSFHLEMMTDLDEVFLYVRGRLAYSGAGVSTALSEHESEAYLTTICGACIEGELMGMGEEDPAEIEITLSPSTLRIGGGTGNGGFSSQIIQPDPDGAFALRAIPAEQSFEVRVLPKELAPDLIDIQRLSSGETHKIRFNLRPGATLSGMVTDPSGRPIEGADVTAIGGRAAVSLSGWVRRKDTSDADGSFSLRGLPVGEVVLAAEHDGFLASGFKTLQLIEGEEMGDLVLTLSEGNSVEGTAHWPDGTPVIDALVSAQFDRSALLGADSINAARGGDGHANTNEEGHFRITALGNGPFTVSVTHSPEGERLESWLAQETRLSSLSGDVGLNKGQAYGWTDQVDGVRPGSPPLKFVLSPPEVIAGRVVDDAGVAVQAYELVMIRLEDSVLGKLGVEDRRLPIDDPEGRFLAPGLARAEWHVYALADGYSIPEPTLVTIPQAEDAATILISLAPAASASGVVLNPNGTPAANAQVKIKTSASGMLANISENLKDASTICDASGNFFLERLHSGVIDLYASADGYAPSAPEEVTLIAGEETTGLRLSLRVGGTITGELYNNDGEHTPNATIQVIKPDDYSTQLSKTDAEGSFRFENLEPGSWQVLGIPNLTGALDDSEGNQGGRAEILKDMEMGFVELEDGAEEHIVLGAPPEDPVTLSGVIRHQNKPVKGATLIFIIEGETTMPKIEVSDSEGRYSVRLDKPGQYMFTVQRAYGGSYQEQSQNTFRVTVPKTVEHHHDIDLPGAMISGRVTTESGAGVASIPITLSPAYEMGYTHSAESSVAQISTNEDGSFSINGVRPGNYFLRAGGLSLGRRAVGAKSEADTEYGQVTLALEILENEHLDGVKLIVEEGGTLKVHVTDSSGAPVDGASIFIRDAAGSPMEMVSVVTTDARGTCIYSGLAEGDYQVSARTTDAATVEGTSFHVSAEETEHVELRLDKGTLLKVVMTDGEGNPVNGRLRVIDSDGREHASYLSIAVIMARMGTDGFSGSQQTIGPLPPGRYRVYARAEDGRETDKPVSLRGQDERSIRIRFR